MVTDMPETNADMDDVVTEIDSLRDRVFKLERRVAGLKIQQALDTMDTLEDMKEELDQIDQRTDENGD